MSYFSKPPASAGTARYFKPQTGAPTKVRIIGQHIEGWLYWTADNHPRRLRERPATMPDDIRVSVESEQPEQVRNFWAIPIYNHAIGAVQIWEVTQVTIMRQLYNLATSEWGDPTAYDLRVERSDAGRRTTYAVTAMPPGPLSAQAKAIVAAAPVNLQALFDGADPFASKATATTTAADAPPFNNRPSAIAWAMRVLNCTLVDAERIYASTKTESNPRTADEMWRAYFEDVMQIAEEQADEDVPF